MPGVTSKNARARWQSKCQSLPFPSVTNTFLAAQYTDTDTKLAGTRVWADGGLTAGEKAATMETLSAAGAMSTTAALSPSLPSADVAASWQVALALQPNHAPNTPARHSLQPQHGQFKINIKILGKTIFHSRSSICTLLIQTISACDARAALTLAFCWYQMKKNSCQIGQSQAQMTAGQRQQACIYMTALIFPMPSLCCATLYACMTTEVGTCKLPASTPSSSRTSTRAPEGVVAACSADDATCATASLLLRSATSFAAAFASAKRPASNTQTCQCAGGAQEQR